MNKNDAPTNGAVESKPDAMNIIYIKKNKWKNQKIHKKYNLIQRSSKHYQTTPHLIISKSKSPLKRRKHKKKIKAQRMRKSIHKTIAYDYADFLNTNQIPILAMEDYVDVHINSLNEHSLQNRFNCIFDIWSLYFDTTNRYKSYNIPTYKQYLCYTPIEAQFSYKMGLFKAEIKDILNDIIYNKRININNYYHCQHEIWPLLMNGIKLLPRYIIHDYFCDYSGEHILRWTQLDLALKDFCMYDIEPLVMEILNEIKNEQMREIEIINKYHFDNSKENWNAYLVYIININGISYDTCDIILDYLSNEYPKIEFQQDPHAIAGYYRGISHISLRFRMTIRLSVKWLHQKEFCERKFRYEYCGRRHTEDIEEFLVDNDFPNIVKCDNLNKLNIFYADKDPVTVDICIGQMEYNELEMVYFYYYHNCFAVDLDDIDASIIFSKSWLDLYHSIKNNSIKINCYSFLFE